jgi:hypothetical protein
VVNDAYKLLPWAESLYAADRRWWEAHHGCPSFTGEKWMPKSSAFNTSAKLLAKKYGINVIPGEWRSGFSRNPTHIHFGNHGQGNSGFQAVNLAILLGATRIILCGFDMREVDGRKHFFGSHPRGLNPNQNFSGWRKGFADAAKALPSGVEIINATPGSALTCFPFMDLQEAIECRAVA